MDLVPREPVLKADPAIQLRLLDVQEHDTRLSQLDHRATHLPEAAELADVEARLRRARDEVVAAETIASDLEDEQKRADRDVEQVRERQARDQELLDSGSIGDPKQLQSIQAELENLARRQTDLEDVELEIMERVEGARAAVAQLTAGRDELVGQREALAATVQEKLAAIAGERTATEAERQAIAADVAPELLALYDKIRGDHGGVGAAPLHRGACQGCRLSLPPTELEEIRSAAPDERSFEAPRI